MNYSTPSNHSNNNTLKNNEYFYHNISYSQFIGIILAGSALLVSISVLIFLIICQRYRLRVSKLNNLGLTSNNPCYVGSSMSQFDGGSSHAHCNMSVSRDFYDIDDLTSLDNDSFLNSLENAIFVGYLNHNRTSYKVDDIYAQSTVHINQPIHSANPVAQASNVNSSRHSYKKSASSRYSAAHSSVKLRNGKLKASTSNTNSSHDSIRIRAKSETISESIGSTSNLITSSKMFLDDSNDSVCDSGKSSQQLAETLATCSRDNNPDTKTGSSTDSHTSVNSSCAMMSGYAGAETSASGQALPDIINSSLPRSSKVSKRPSNTYSHSLNRDDSTITSSTGQILDPLRAGQNLQFVTDIVQPSTNQAGHTHERRISYNMGLFDYQISS